MKPPVRSLSRFWTVTVQFTDFSTQIWFCSVRQFSSVVNFDIRYGIVCVQKSLVLGLSSSFGSGAVEPSPPAVPLIAFSEFSSVPLEFSSSNETEPSWNCWEFCS